MRVSVLMKINVLNNLYITESNTTHVLQMKANISESQRNLSNFIYLSFVIVCMFTYLSRKSVILYACWVSFRKAKMSNYFTGKI